MRRMTLGIAVVVAIVASYGLASRHHPLAGTSGTPAGNILYYMDPMHPSYKSDKPGVAPDCGMPLVPVLAEDAAKGAPVPPLAQLPAGTVSIDGATRRLFGIRLRSVEKSSASRVIHVVGRVAPEDTRVYRLNSGRVELLS